VFNVGPAELIVILLAIVLVFGPKRLPEIGRTMGRSLQQFREATSELRREVKGTLDEVDIRKDIAGIGIDMRAALRSDPPAASTPARQTEPARSPTDAPGIAKPTPLSAADAEPRLDDGRSSDQVT
jgi:sec-independent protein translocase protein TatA